MPDGPYPENRKKWPKVLAFDTSGPHLCIGTTYQSYSSGKFIDMPRGQAEELFPAIEKHLDRVWSWSDIDVIGVGIGPGNFTGVRISVSAARGLGLALGIPVFGLNQFILSYGSHNPPSGTLVSLPAPRGMAYVKGFGVGDKKVLEGMLIDPCDPPPETQLSFGMQIYGHRALDIAAKLDAVGYEEQEPHYPEKMAEITECLYCDAEGFPPRPAPLYLRPADAAPARDAPPVILS